MIIAELTKWNGEKVEQEIKRDWIQDFVDAVSGQFTILNKEKGYGIIGGSFAHIDVYEVEK